MTEIRIGFESLDEYRSWRSGLGRGLDDAIAALVANVREKGLTEPYSNLHFAQVGIDPAKLQVSLDAGGLNSRKRAGLLAVQAAVASLPPARRNKAKILGTEGVTRIAAILRGAFPYYMSTEYLPLPQEQKDHYPIEHLDLMDIKLPAETFDIFFSAHVLEHVPDVQHAIHQIARVMRPGGVIVSTYPFRADRVKTETKAIIDEAGNVKHLTEPEYHGNPVRVGEGSLVFQLPGWDVIDMCRNAGLTDAKLLVLASSRYGVVSPGSLGIFALYARKPVPGEAKGTKLPVPVSFFGECN